MARSSRPRPFHQFGILCIGDQGLYYGSCVGHAQYILEYHVNVQIKKVPRLAIQCNVKDMRAWFQKE